MSRHRKNARGCLKKGLLLELPQRCGIYCQSCQASDVIFMSGVGIEPYRFSTPIGFFPRPPDLEKSSIGLRPHHGSAPRFLL